MIILDSTIVQTTFKEIDDKGKVIREFQPLAARVLDLENMEEFEAISKEFMTQWEKLKATPSDK